jgi:hypothetical protein
MKKLLLFTAICLICSSRSVWSQNQTDTTRGIQMPAKIEHGDTIILANMAEIDISTSPKPVFESRREERRYTRLVFNVKKVYPYAKMARAKLVEMNEHFKTLTSEKQKNEYTKQVEKEIRDQFEDQLKDLTRTQGFLLIKLIDRETGMVSYELVKEFRGNFSAFFWQALARLFGLNLKTQYDPNGEDKPIEDIIKAIDAGMI